MTDILKLEEIEQALVGVDLLKIMEEGFAAYSRGDVVVPPVGELIFDDPPGEAHIKYGYIKGDDYYVIKIASGFYKNPSVGLASSQGMMLVFSQKTGVLDAVLLDEGHLTDLRTAAAGAVASKYLAPKKVSCIGILGAGTQGKLQLSHLRSITPCKEALIWTPNDKEEEEYIQFFKGEELNIDFVSNCHEIAERCNLIVTTTPSRTPLLAAGDIRPGTHITAVGSDTSEKIELDPEILGNADVVVVDSLSQSKTRGEIFRAVQAKALQRDRVLELGAVVLGGQKARTSENQITVADLTGVAVLDIQIAKAVYENARQLQNKGKPQ